MEKRESSAASHVTPARVESLDALRLVAAFVVFFQHFMVIMGISFPSWLSKGPLDSQAAVTLFFVLSGYVLAQSISRETPSVAGYLRFGVRRVLRLYPLYWSALLMAFVIYMLILRSGGLAVQSEYIPGIFADGEVRWRQWLLHLLMVDGRIDHTFAIPPVWTLLVEARIAVIFPLVVWGLYRASWATAGMLWLCLVAASGWLEGHHLGLVAILGEFVVGIMLAKVPFEAWRFGPRGWPVFFMLSLLFFSAIAFRFSHKWPAQYACAVGAAGLVVCAIHWNRCHQVLAGMQKFFRVDLSYGLYILHYPLMMGLLKLKLSGNLPVNSITSFFLLLLITCVTAWILNKLVEVPFIGLGRTLTRRKVEKQQL